MFIDDCKITAEAPTATGTSAIDSAAYDMAGFQGICFVVRLGTPAANNNIRVRQETTAGGAYADLTDTAVTHATNNQLVVDVARTGEQFIKCRVTRGTTTTIDSLVVIQYGARLKPVTQPTASTSEKFMAAVEGTA
jgi:hypothetical protein